MKRKLEAIRDQLADGKLWCANYAAVNELGSPVHPEQGVRWDLVTTIQRMFPREAADIKMHLLVYAKRMYDRKYLADVNDWDGHAAVMKLLDKAISDLEV